MVIKHVITSNCQNCVSLVANQSDYLRRCYYSIVSLRVKCSCLQTALTGQRSKGWQGRTTEGSLFSQAVFLAHMSPLQRTRIRSRKRAIGSVMHVRCILLLKMFLLHKENTINIHVFTVCRAATWEAMKGRQRLIGLYQRHRLRWVQKQNFCSIFKQNRHFWTNTDKNGMRLLCVTAVWLPHKCMGSSRKNHQGKCTFGAVLEFWNWRGFSKKRISASGFPYQDTQ